MKKIGFNISMKKLFKCTYQFKKKFVLTLLFLFIISSLINANTYFVSASASSSGNGTQNNPWTLSIAIANSLPGDTIYIYPGDYDISNGGNFNKSGTAANPIVWIGTLHSADYATVDANTTRSTVLTNYTSVNGDGQISVSGNYQEFHSIVFRNLVSGKGTMNISGIKNKLTNCAFKYPGNGYSSSNHTLAIPTTGVATTLDSVHFYNGSRCIIYARADSLLVEYCTFTNATNHPPLQIMPATNVSGPTIKGAVVRNNKFIDNPYGNLYTRLGESFKYYNNLFVRSGSPFDVETQPVYDDSSNAKGSIIAYNTIIEDEAFNAVYNAGLNQVYFKNNLIYSTQSTVDFIWKHAADINAIYRHDYDYNLYYFTAEQFLQDEIRGSWGAGNTSVWWSDWTSVTGQETNSIVDVEPTFGNTTTYPPLNGSSPQVEAGTPISGITTDFYGNPRDPVNPTIGAIEFINGNIVDITPPQVVSAVIVDSVKLNVYFSENLDPNSAQNINNYNIAGISITNAALSANVVTLTTSIHTPGNYSVVVSNVTDLSGNIIDPQHNSAVYEYQADSISGLLRFPVSNVLESVLPEPQHNGEKTIDGKGFYQGDPESRWSGDTMPEWLVYDIGDVQVLNVTRLSFYKWNEGRTYNYSIQVSTDSVVWTTVRANALSVTEEWSEEVVGPIDARYIKVIFISSNQNSWAGLWESEFWGYFKNPTNLEDEETTPTVFVLEQNYPNPFNPSTVIRVHLPQGTQMRLAVYNMLGEEVTELTNAEYEAGTYEFNFDATGLASGVYIYRMESPIFIETKKMLLIR